MGDRTRPRRRPRRKGGTLKDGERRQLARASRHAGEPVAPAGCDRALALCDGGSRGNPGTAAAAAILLGPDGSRLAERAELIGHASAGEAEYQAILIGLALAEQHSVRELEVRSDSQLAIAALERGVREDVRAAASGFADVRWRWQPRGENEAADELVRRLLWPPP